MATSSTCLSSSPYLPSRHRLLRRLKVHTSASVTAPDHHRSSSSPSLWHSAITTHLLSSIPTTLPPSVSDPMLHLITSAPPAVSPALCLAACEVACGAHAAALGAAAALQLMHAAVHAHAAILRRHRSGCAAGGGGKYPDGVELMAADGMLPLGYELVARSATQSGAAAAVRVVAEMAAAMEGVGEGRLLEAEWEEAVVELTEGRMAACGAACGAVLGGEGEETVERMRRLGLYVGMMCGLLGREGGVGPTARARAGEFRRLAGLELEGMEEERVEVVRGLVEFFWHETTE